jgi:hypothetical protein
MSDTGNNSNDNVVIDDTEDLWSQAPLGKQIARMMAEGDDSDVDWDGWADNLKETY